MKKVVAYVRVSSQSQIENTSIETQIEKIELHCKLHDIVIDKIFKDEGLSAKDTNDRNSYNEMISYILDKNNNIDSVVVYKSDRLHRSLKNLLITIEDIFIPNNISFISITEQFDTSNAQGMLFLQMLGSFAEFERKLINERTKVGRLSKGKSELYVGGRVAFGYTLINNDTLTLNYEEAEIIKDIFKMRTKGISIGKIAYKHNMSKSKIHYILNNKLYMGVYNYNGKKEKNKISFKVPPIVSNYIWTKANLINK